MKLEDHCEECEEILGKPFREVHLWLDEFAKNYPWQEKYKHRKFRHHKEGVEEARKLFGDEGAKAAELHIMSDNYGWIPNKNDYDIPDYRDDYHT